MRFILTVVVCLSMMVLVPLQSLAGITLTPPRYEWANSNTPPWSIEVDGCNFAEVINALEFVLVKGDGINFYMLESLYSDYYNLEIVIEMCPLQAIKEVTRGEIELIFYFYILFQDPKFHLLVRNSRQESPVARTIAVEMRMHLWGESLLKKEDRLRISGNTWFTFRGMLSWYLNPSVAKDEIKILILDVELARGPGSDLGPTRGPSFSIYKTGQIPVAEILREITRKSEKPAEKSGQDQGLEGGGSP